MDHHYLLQTWLTWWQGAGIALTTGALNSFEKNALSNFWRDIGNLITGAGAGWAATRDAFFELFGINVPAEQPQTGDEAVRDTIGSFFHQIFDGLLGGEPGTSSTSSASGSSSTGNAPTTNLADVLPAEFGGKTTLADVVEAAKSKPGN